MVGEALIQEQQVLAFKRPSARPLATFRKYFFGGDGNDTPNPILDEQDEYMLDDPRDLVALAPMDDDRLGSFLRNQFGWCCQVRMERRANSFYSKSSFYQERF